jgi:hypothetical protein
MIQAWIPAKRIAEAAALPWVAAVTPPDYGYTNPHPNNPINSEESRSTTLTLRKHRASTEQALRWASSLNGVANLAASQARNELPAVNVISAGSGDEGTAMLEIVHDMAPGAALAFHASGSHCGHVTAVQNGQAAGVNVIGEDLAFDAQPAFQQGVVANAREAAAIAGVSVHSSSGNRGQNHAARRGGGTEADRTARQVRSRMPCSRPTSSPIAPGNDTTFDMTLGNPTSFTCSGASARHLSHRGSGGFTNLDLGSWTPA